MRKVRFEFQKTGRARFLSHLDVMRVLQRALTRTGAPVAYSEGYNPHMHLSILLPLPLGLESRCELADIRLADDAAVGGAELVEAMNQKLPEGFLLTRTLEAGRAAQEIKWVEFELAAERAEGFCENASAALNGVSDGRPLVIDKKTKRGIEKLDIAPYVKDAAWECDGAYTLKGKVTLSAQGPTINPSHLLDAIRLAEPEHAPDMIYGTRVRLLDQHGKPFA